MTNSRGKKLKYNTISSLVFQITTIVCGFVLPRLIIANYGSMVNGLVNSITQFLQIIAFLELGVGAVVQSSLYKPLVDHDNILISKIVRSAGKFFSKIAIILTVYIGVLIAIWPLLINRDFDFLYTGTLIVAIAISSFSQYYFGIVERLLLSADQKGYIQYNAQTITLVVNTVLCAILINMGASIHVVKITTSIVYLFRPLALRIYVNKHYNIDRRITYIWEPIKQKWNGIAQHVAAVVLDQTDIIVLTVFSTLSNVSIYSVYQLVIHGVKNLLLSLTSGFQALMGEYIAREDTKSLGDLFDWVEWLLHTGTTLIFGCTAILVVPFVAVYTKGINDADYIVPLFAVLLTVAHAGHCLRLPYNLLILAAGHYKQTQSNYIIAAAMNIIISVLTVRTWGLIGVAIGTLCAMAYQTVWMAFYDSKHFIPWAFKSFAKHICVDVLTATIASLITVNISMKDISYVSWVLLAAIVFSIWFSISLIVNFIFYKEKMMALIQKARKRLLKKSDV